MHAQRIVHVRVSTQRRNLPVLELAFPFPVLAPISSTVLFWIPLPKKFPFGTVPKRAICQYWSISGIGLCQFRYGHSLGPVPELDSMRAVPFPVRGSASSGTVIHFKRSPSFRCEGLKEERGSAFLITRATLHFCTNIAVLERRERSAFLNICRASHNFC